MATIPGVSPAELIRSSWGNSVATELNTRVVKTDGSMPVTGPLICSGNPPLRLRRTGDTPFIRFENTTGATQFAIVQASSTQLIYSVDYANGEHSFKVGGVEVAVIDHVGLTLAAGKTVTSDGMLQGSTGRFGSTVGNQVQVVDVNGGGDTALANLAFYPSAASIASIGARGAYVGYQGDGFQVEAQGKMVLQSVGNNIDVVAAGQINWAAGGATRGSIIGAAFLFGKTASNLNTRGVELYGVGSAQIGSVRSTVTDAAVQNLYLTHGGAADADGKFFAEFWRATGGTRIGSITQDGTTGVLYNKTSDYRLKNVAGPIVDGVERLRLLRPVRFTWIGDEAGGERDGFLAHEVAAVVPEAVTGVKDAVAPDPGDDPGAPAAGTIDPQQLDASQLIPLLTAATLELAARVEALEAV